MSIPSESAWLAWQERTQRVARRLGVVVRPSRSDPAWVEVQLTDLEALADEAT